MLFSGKKVTITIVPVSWQANQNVAKVILATPCSYLVITPEKRSQIKDLSKGNPLFPEAIDNSCVHVILDDSVIQKTAGMDTYQECQG